MAAQRTRTLVCVCYLALPLLTGCLTAGVIDHLADRFEPLDRQRVTETHLDGDVRVVRMTYSNRHLSRRETFRLQPLAPGRPVPEKDLAKHIPRALYRDSIIGWCVVVAAVPFTLATDLVLFPLQPYWYFRFFFRASPW